MQPIELATPDGLKLKGKIHTPNSDDIKGTVLQAHGITVDMDEGGMFVRLAESLAESGFNVLRFSYRGHGESDGAEESATIAGEMIDLDTVLNWLYSEFDGPYYIIAASFGAVSACNLLEYIEPEIDGLALWNPVLDLEKTFINPELDWGISNFTGEKIDDLYEQGFLMVDDDFRLGRVLYSEFQVHDPLQRFLESSIPAIIIHGDSDSAVSYDVARQAARDRSNCEMYTIKQADHGFDSLEEDVPTARKENKAITLTQDWLLNK